MGKTRGSLKRVFVLQIWYPSTRRSIGLVGLLTSDVGLAQTGIIIVHEARIRDPRIRGSISFIVSQIAIDFHVHSVIVAIVWRLSLDRTKMRRIGILLNI